MSENNESLKNNIEGESETKAKLEKTAENLKNELKSLEKVNSLLRNRISELEQENQKLKQDLEHIGSESESHSQIEDNVVNLQKKSAKLTTENVKLKEELKLSKGEETIKEPASRVQDLIQKRHVAIESKKVGGETWKDETQIKDIPIGKVKDLIEKKQTTLKEVETSKKVIKKPEKIQKTSVALKDSVNETSQIERFSKQIQEAPDEKDAKIVLELAEGRRKCPKCGNSNQKLIKEIVDKKKIISTYGGLFGKKYKCAQCGTEWR